MKLIRDDVAVIPIEEEETTKGGIILGASKVPENLATVVAVADGVKDVKVGDVIKRYPHSGRPLNHEDKDYLILSEDKGIICII